MNKNQEIVRKRPLEFLKSSEPVWKDENHPELAKGAAEWVRKLRREGDLATRKRLGKRT